MLGVAACGSAPKSSDGASSDGASSGGASSSGASSRSARTPIGRRSAALLVSDAPATLAFGLELEGQSLTLSLERSPLPTTHDYQSFRQRADGTLVPVAVPQLGCSYRGGVVPSASATGVGNGGEAFAAVSVCSDATGRAAGQAVAGVMRAAGRFWQLSPDPADLDAEDGVDHFALPLSRADTPLARAEPARRVTLARRPESPALRLPFREGTPEETKYIELVLVSDAARVAELGGQAEATGIRFVDTMNALLEQSGLEPRLRVTLRAQVLFDADPYVPAFVGDEVNHESLLNEFLAWGNDVNLPAHDEHLLLSGLDFLGGTVGYAGLDTACTANSNGFIVQAGDAGGGFAVLSAVHELGHTLGMSHDDGINCAQTGFIMAAVGCANCPSDNLFSSCSIEQFGAYLAGPAYAGPRCADDVPGSGVAACGDGAVQAGETCDCGASDCSGIDPCCDGARCELRPGAECSDYNDGCCQGCAIVSAAALLTCRAAQSECDSPEVCTGFGKDCPADNFEPAARDCEDEQGNPGACYFGDCRSRTTQCEQIAEGEGADFANVGAPGPGCDAACDRVICGNGPNSCVIISGPTVSDGVRCDTGQCINQACVALVDQCPNDAAKTEPGLCGCGTADTDGDADGTPNCSDGCPTDAEKRAPGPCGCGRTDIDTDADGLPDCSDACPDDRGKRAPGVCGCGMLETDGDGDGTPDCKDECPDDPLSTTAGVCGCGLASTDSDSDGSADCVDSCPMDPTHDAPPCVVPSGIARNPATFRASSSGSCAVTPALPSAPVRPLAQLAILALITLPLLRRRR